MPSFAITGCGGAVAPRHLDAIATHGGRLVGAHDVRDAVGVLDRYDVTVPFFTDLERFRAHLQELAETRGAPLDYLSVCAPNDVHVEHCRLGLGLGADVVCEKPIAIDPRDLDLLEEAERRSGRRIWTVLQLRNHAALVTLREKTRREGGLRDVVLTYVTTRGPWYDVSWKGDARRSGGIAMNIGVHMFDLLVWLFGDALDLRVHMASTRRMAGELRLERAKVRWLLSIEGEDLPAERRARGERTFRELAIDGERVDFSAGALDLHARVYERVLSRAGEGIREARPAIELAHRAARAAPELRAAHLHPLLAR